jgi:hypothetical protein
MNLLSNINLSWTWPQVFALLLLALVGAFLAERLVGNAPKYGFLGSLVLGVLGAWLFTAGNPARTPAGRYAGRPGYPGRVGAGSRICFLA